MYLVKTGFLRFYKLVNGKEIFSGFIGEHEYIREYASFLTRRLAHKNIDVLEDASLLLLHYNDMQWLYKKFQVYEKFARKLAEFLFIIVSDISYSLLVISPEERYQKLVNSPSPLLQ